MKEALLQESNELEGHQAARLPQPQCSSAGPPLGSHPPSSATIIQASTSLFCGPMKGGEVNEAWGGNYTNANRQMSHIVPGYNKQYGCLCYICIRKGGALGKPCFDCFLQGPTIFFSPCPPLSLSLFIIFFLGSDLLPFLCEFYFLVAKLFVELLVEVLPVEDSCVSHLSLLAAGMNFEGGWLTLCCKWSFKNHILNV